MNRSTKWAQFVPANNLVTIHTTQSTTGTTALTGNERGDNRTGSHEVETIEGEWVSVAGLIKTMTVGDASRILRASVDAQKAAIHAARVRP